MIACGYVTIFPASAGVFLIFPGDCSYPSYIPRVCGGVSAQNAITALQAEYSPHPRKCFLRLGPTRRLLSVFPASAGVFPTSSLLLPRRCHIPRVCGGVSASQVQYSGGKEYSPRLRGCFQACRWCDDHREIFPASVGVLLRSLHSSGHGLYIPRVCGGVSSPDATRSLIDGYSPRLRGCFLLPSYVTIEQTIFPASAGVFPAWPPSSRPHRHIPRVCGGVSLSGWQLRRRERYSPRLRECFL